MRLPGTSRQRVGALPLMLMAVFSLASQIQDHVAPDLSPALARFKERSITFASAGEPLKGTLTLPQKATGKLPVVVLIGGSGPHPAVTSAQTGAMFADLARGLASVGIASLRYEERPFAFLRIPDHNRLPLDEQILDPALAAMEYASQLPELDASAIFVLGHDVGGTLAPYVAERHSQTRGIILLAAAAQGVEKSLAAQKRRSLRAFGVSDEEMAEQLEAQNRILSDIRSGKTAPARAVAGATAAYWRDRMNRDPSLKARDLGLPVLVLQGALDLEVNEDDYERLRSVLEKKRGTPAEFQSFPRLNHLFMGAQRISSDKPGTEGPHVDSVVVQTIARWIRSNLSRRPAGR